MFSFVIKRLLQAILVMLIVTMIAFLLFQFVGDPVTQMLGQEATEADRLALTHELGLGQPIWKQFGAFIANTLHGDFGMSLRQGTPVVDLFKEKCRLRSSSHFSLPWWLRSWGFLWACSSL